MARRISSSLLLASVLILDVSPCRSADNPSSFPALMESVPQAKLFKKLKTIIIGKIDFKDSSLLDVLHVLTVESKRFDPAHEGVNFVLPLYPDIPPPKLVTLELNNIPLREAIRYSLFLADPNLHYYPENGAIYIGWDNEKGLFFRAYVVPKGFICTSLDKSRNAEQQLKDKGIKFAPGSSAVYHPETKTLTVVNTADQVELIEELINGWTRPIQTQPGDVFVPINQ